MRDRLDWATRCFTGFFLSLAFVLSANAHQQPVGEARYLGNEGVLVVVEGQKILLDAFYSQGFGTYALVPERVVSDMLDGRPPYDQVSAVFVSHVHGDHFSVAPMLAYLRAQPDVLLFCPRQVEAAIAAATDEVQILERIRAIGLAPGETPQSIKSGPLDIDVAAVPHAGGERMADVRNLVFRISLANKHTLVHLGDAAIDVKAFSELSRFWQARDVDTAFPPYWFLGNETGLEILRDHVSAGRVIGIHVPAAAIGRGEEWRARLEGDLFTDPGESRRLVHEH
jgi:L-ascorbate metabolism protein UlaG (beta-lactamase superfamily)